jgi:two-component system, LytTR family, sensor kinase
MRTAFLSRSGRAWLAIVGAWLIWALLSAVELTSRLWFLKEPFEFHTALLAKLPLALVLAAVTPAILYLSRRFPLLGAPRRRRWEVHLAGCLILVALIDAISCAITSAMSPEYSFSLGTPREYVIRVLGLWLLPIGLLYWFIVLIDHGIRHFVAARDQAEARARLEAQAANSRLEALKLQLHPHFLFNALHSIAALVRTGRSDEAVRIAGGLGDLLRQLLDDAPIQEVPLRDELAFIRDYLDIEMIRFSDRLSVEYDISPGSEDALVPHLILQPLVENALRHGLQPLARGGTLTISARTTGDQLELTVADDGVGLQPAEQINQRTGRGLANVQSRLAALYGTRQSCELASLNGSGSQTRIVLPYRVAGSPGLVSHR